MKAEVEEVVEGADLSQGAGGLGHAAPWKM